MRTVRSLVSIFKQPNYKRKTKCMLLQRAWLEGYVFPAVCFSDKKCSVSSDKPKGKCQDEPKPLDVCVKAETIQVLSKNEPPEPIPKDCGKPKIDTSSDASLRPFVNPCPLYPPCDPCVQPVHPCREKPPRIPIIRPDVKEELSLRTKKILLALSALVGGVIIYKALTKPEESLAPGRKKIPRCVLRPQYITKTPDYKTDIPVDAPYLIVGGGTAAFSAFRTIKSLEPTARILVISEEPYTPYMRPPLTKDLVYSTDRNLSREHRFKTDKGQSRSIYYEPDEFFTPVKEFETNQNGAISIVKGWTVKSIDPDKKTVSIQDGPTIKYNKCLLATGSRAKNIGVFECNTDDVAEKVTTYRTVYDYMEIEDVINCGAKKIAIIGGNNVACELAASLSSRGIEVIQIFKENGVLAQILPSYLSEWVTKKMEKEGITLLRKTAVEDAMIANGKLKLITKERKGISVDHAVVVSGYVPNTELANGSGIEVDPVRDGFVVNREMQIKTDLFAAGDCASFYDPKLNERRRLENHDHAIATGRIAGENMLGRGKTYDKESTFWCAIMPGIEFESVGIIDSKLATVGVFLDKENVTKIINTETKKLEPSDEYNRGVLFYLKKQKVVGVTMWNMLGRAIVAQRILWSNVPYEHLDDSAKLFGMHVAP